VAQGVLAGQQQLAQAPVIAGLENTGYQQAVSTAENQQQAGLTGATNLANIGNSVQSSGLAGANAQIGAGTLQQQTQQAQDTANYGQYAQAQAYPYQQQQWLAGIEGQIAPGLGSTSSTTGPPPNQYAQYLGAGVAGAGLALSDRRAKDDIHKIGNLNDGTPIYRYRYKGQQEWHIGPIAQEVERNHPEHVHQGGVGGFKYVDLKGLTDDSVHKAGGGAVAGLAVGGTPWSFAQGWVPSFSGSGSTAPHASGPGMASTASPAIDYSKLGSAKISPDGGLFGPQGPIAGGSAYQNSTGGYNGMTDAEQDAAQDAGLLARGGGVHGYADGGAPDDPFGDDNRQIAYDMLRQNNGTQAPRSIPGGEPVPGLAGASVWNPDQPYRMPDRPADNSNPTDDWRAGRPIPPLGTAPVVAGDDGDELPPQITGRASGASPGVGGAMSYAAGQPGGFRGPASAPEPDEPPEKKGLGIGLGLISPNAQTGLLAAGLGMLASRSPFLGNAIGEGGIGGLQAYGAAEEKDRQVAAEAKKLSVAAQNHADEMKLRQSQEDRATRDAPLVAGPNGQPVPNKALIEYKKQESEATSKDNWAPIGSLITKDGEVHPLLSNRTDGKVLDATTGQAPDYASGKVIQKGEKPVIPDEDAKAVAERYVRTGDRTQLQGLGVSGAARQKVNHYIHEVQQELGVSDEDLGTKVAEFEGRKAGQRTLGTQEAKMGSAAFEAEGAIKQARGVIEKLPRTSFLPLNQLMQGYSRNTLNPDQAELAARTQAIINTYSAVMARGANVTTDSSRSHAEALLNTAANPESFNRVLDTMLQEINMAKGSPAKMREFYRQQYGAKALAPEVPGTAPPVAGATAAPAAIPPAAERVVGQIYQTPKGPAKWTGQGWVQ